jgi:hypothetical protein
MDKELISVFFFREKNEFGSEFPRENRLLVLLTGFLRTIQK